MLKFRITYYNKDELKKAIKALGKNFIILGTSKSYSCRNSNAKNIYLEVKIEKIKKELCLQHSSLD